MTTKIGNNWKVKSLKIIKVSEKESPRNGHTQIGQRQERSRFTRRSFRGERNPP